MKRADKSPALTCGTDEEQNQPQEARLSRYEEESLEVTSQWTLESAQEQASGKGAAVGRARVAKPGGWEAAARGSGCGGRVPRGTHGRKPGPEEGLGNGRNEGPGMSGVGWHHMALLTYSTSLGQGAATVGWSPWQASPCQEKQGWGKTLRPPGAPRSRGEVSSAGCRQGWAPGRRSGFHCGDLSSVARFLRERGPTAWLWHIPDCPGHLLCLGGSSLLPG